MIRTPLAVVALMLLAHNALGDEKRGYWWYEEPPGEVQREADKRVPLPAPPPPQEMMAMHPDELQELGDAYLKQAVWTLTPEDVRHYLRIQDVQRRKAAGFASVSQFVLQADSALNVAREYPVTNPGRDATTRLRHGERNRTLGQYREHYALLFFTKPGCEWCAIQAATLKHFQSRHQWEIREIDILQQPTLAARFAIDFTPSLVVVERRSDQWMPVAVGVEALPTLEDHLTRALRYLRGELNPTQFLTREHQRGGVFDPALYEEPKP